ncbi:MAG: phosphate signaling complex PhoU family protein, partial [Pirellulaceae bacterium]
MLRLGLDAFVKSDTAQALSVIRMESRVDDQNRDSIRELSMLITSDTNLVEPALHVFSAARNIEQISDLAENIAEEIIYMIDGEIVRHKFSASQKAKT